MADEAYTHDYALLTVPYGFNPVAARAIECHRSMLDGSCMDHRKCESQLEFLKNLPMKHEEVGQTGEAAQEEAMSSHAPT